MSYQLPESFYRESTRRSLNLKRLRVWSVLMIIFALWNVFTPWGLIRRNMLAREFPNSEFGIQGAYINEDGALVIERRGYVDRMSQYIYSADGGFSAHTEYDMFTGVRLDSAPRMGSKYMTSGYAIDIKPGDLTRKEIRKSSRQIRRESDPGQVTDTQVPIFRDDGLADIRSLKELADTGVVIPDVELGFESGAVPDIHKILPGHVYLPFRDSHCYVDPRLTGDGEADMSLIPSLYITTDGGRYLHHLTLNPDQYSDNWVQRERTVFLDLPLDRRFDSYLGHDPLEPQLLLVNSDGRISRFDDASLTVLSSEFLEGNWQREYASLFQGTTFYSTEFGIALTRVQAFRIYRGLAVMLLAGLVLLICGYLPGAGGITETSEDTTVNDSTATAGQSG